MKVPGWAETLLRIQLDPNEEEMIVGDFREEFSDISERQGRFRATIWYCLQVASFLREGGAERMLGVTSLRSLWIASAKWLVVFAGVVITDLWIQPFSPVPSVVAFLAIIPLAALDTARRTGYLRTGLLLGSFLGITMFLGSAFTIAQLHLPHPPLSPIPVVVTLAASTVGATAGRRFQRFGHVRY